ncbi:hypothetical protein JTE90_022805 [Oedothorax gibbosus]|uniref:Uncharacterized protein n=1 Tax=Oedothorax gibbosus TaxID=931172 RepID=A0AAV6V5R1_9ARAC|nr:hypothetical protein JTE90_022805 [Oedothorax gibbosus]
MRINPLSLPHGARGKHRSERENPKFTELKGFVISLDNHIRELLSKKLSEPRKKIESLERNFVVSHQVDFKCSIPFSCVGNFKNHSTKLDQQYSKRSKIIFC